MDFISKLKILNLIIVISPFIVMNMVFPFCQHIQELSILKKPWNMEKKLIKPKLTCVYGLPKSGKTTKVLEIMEKNHGTYRISIDDIRLMTMLDLPYDRGMDGTCLGIENQLIQGLLSAKKDVVVDGCFLDYVNTNRYKQLAEREKANFESIFINTEIKTCIYRDSISDNSVGKDCILNLAFKHGIAKQEKEFVIFEIDYCLSPSSAKHLNTNLTSYFYTKEGILGLTPNWDKVMETIELTEKNIEIIIFTMRPESTRELTEQWLDMKGVHWDRLIMREDSDNREEADFKKSSFFELMDPNKLKMVYDKFSIMRDVWDDVLQVAV